MTRALKSTVLLITRSTDLSAQPVVDALRERGARAIRFNTDRFPTEDDISIQYRKGSVSAVLNSNDKAFDLSKVSAVWYRRLGPGERIPQTMDENLRSTSAREARVTVQGMLAALDAFMLDPIPNVQQAEHKPLQLRLAQRFGLEVPRTLFTNQPDAVREFARSCKCKIVSKMPAAVAIANGEKLSGVYTNPIAATDLEDLEGLKFCPMIFQERIDKKLEMRAVVVGNRIFAAAVDSQGSEETKVDWRRGGAALAQSWNPYQLPRSVAKGLMRIVDHLGLNYGAFDLILTPEGRHVFLELNPSGEFLWLDLYTKLPIAQAIADVLVGEHRRKLRRPLS